jgi:hypothetical protein
MTNKSCTKITLERFKEFTAKVALLHCQGDAKCWKFVAENCAKPKAKLDRQYLWWVLVTLRADFVAQLEARLFSEG